MTKKMAKFSKVAKRVFSWPVHFKNGESVNPGPVPSPVCRKSEPLFSSRIFSMDTRFARQIQKGLK